MYWLFILLIAIFGFAVLIYALLVFIDRQYLYRQWNNIIMDQCKYQNETDRAFNNIPSLQSAWVCQNEHAKKLHQSIYLIHDEFLVKIEEYFRVMLDCVDEDTSINKGEKKNKGGIRYFPFWINSTSTQLVKNFELPDFSKYAFNLTLLIVEPGTVTAWKKGISKGFYRYHYALKLPKTGEYGLYLRDKKNNTDEDTSVYRVKWRTKKGFIWDASFDHYISNQSNEPCLLLIADIPRYLSWKYHSINTWLHTYFPVDEYSLT